MSENGCRILGVPKRVQKGVFRLTNALVDLGKNGNVASSALYRCHVTAALVSEKKDRRFDLYECSRSGIASILVMLTSRR